jgi:hypothetical protein
LNAFLVACACCASGGLLTLLAQFPCIFIFLKASHRLKKHFVLLWCNFLTLKLVFHNHWTPWLFLVNLTQFTVPPLKFPNPAPVLRLFYVTIHNSSFNLSTIPPSQLSPWYVFWILCEIDRTNCIGKICHMPTIEM